MRESMISKVLMMVVLCVICIAGTYTFTRMMFGHIHMHPPTEHDIREIREGVKKDLEKHGNEAARRSAKNGDIPFVRHPKD